MLSTETDDDDSHDIDKKITAAAKADILSGGFPASRIFSAGFSANAINIRKAAKF